MIGKLRGQVSHLGSGWLILDVGGVGYKVKVQGSKFKVQNEVELFIHHYIREDRSDLYGFLTLEELQLFEMLLTVSGVGPKVAQAIISQIGASRLQEGLAGGEVSLLETVGGVGRKLAQKIVVELRPRVAEGEFELGALEEESEVVEALKALGYQRKEIVRALKELPPDLKETSEKLRWCLRFLGRKT